MRIRPVAMRIRVALAVAVVAAGALWTWRSQLFTVGRPGDRQRPLALRDVGQRPAIALDVVLPAVPVGMRRLRQGARVLLIHYWAPWERNARTQAAALDSLSRLEAFDRLDLALVCFDPFPSVARFVARQRLRLLVLIDGQGQLRRTLPCPSVPFTYVLDSHGRLAVSQPGEVDWLGAETRRVLKLLIDEAQVPAELVSVRRSAGLRAPEPAHGAGPGTSKSDR